MVSFDFTIEFVYPLEIRYTTNIKTREDGTEKRITVMPLPLHIFEVKMLAQTDTERGALEDFFEARKGRFETFTFTDPVDSTVYTVRFDEDKLDFKKRPDSLWDITLKLRQVL